MGFDWLHNRRVRHSELIDEDAADPVELRRALAFIRRINRALGYARSIVRAFDGFSRSWKRGERIDVVDLATGSADIPRALLRWSRERGFDLRVTAVDRHPVTVAEARAGGEDERLTIVQGDVFDLPFAPASFDYAMCAMFLHHLSEEQIVQVLGTMDRLARRGILAADVVRRRRAYAWISLFTLAAPPMVKHDARVSVAQCLSSDEMIALRDRAGVGYADYRTCFGHRFVMAGEKPPARTGTGTQQ